MCECFLLGNLQVSVWNVLLPVVLGLIIYEDSDLRIIWGNW